MSEIANVSIRNISSRRDFLSGTAAAFTVGLCGTGLVPQADAADAAGLDIIGPKPGYAPQVGTFVSMLTWMRDANGVLSATKGLTQTDLDVLFDKNAHNRRADDASRGHGNLLPTAHIRRDEMG